MKYCLRYTNICTKLNRADEITIKYIEDKGLVAFLEKYKSKRVNLLISATDFPDTEMKKLIAIKKTYPNYRFAVAINGYNYDLMLRLREAELPFYMATPCTDWELFRLLIAVGVCDINVSGPLAFEMSKVKRVLDSLDRKVQVRATPNSVEKFYSPTESVLGFFIRPEDTDAYEGYIDIFDFEGLDMQDVFYDIYAERKTFIGNLNQCIYGFKEPVDNKGLISLFGERRRDCGRQCLRDGRCRRCYSLLDLANPMGERACEKILEILRKEQEKYQSSES